MRILPPVQEDDRMLAGLCYPFWFFVGPLVLFSSRRREPFLQFHARQGLYSGAASILGTLLVTLIVWLLFQILSPGVPDPGTIAKAGPAGTGGRGTVAGFLGVFLFGAAWLGLLFGFCLFLFLGYRASAGEFMMLPWIGKRAMDRVMQDLDLDLEDLSERPDEPPAPRETGPATPPPELVQLRPPPAPPREAAAPPRPANGPARPTPP
ncbi:MAG: hypothetical protein AB1758_37350, partial [Candidatus Eremiobacterota bacterium]